MMGSDEGEEGVPVDAATTDPEPNKEQGKAAKRAAKAVRKQVGAARKAAKQVRKAAKSEAANSAKAARAAAKAEARAAKANARAVKKAKADAKADAKAARKAANTERADAGVPAAEGTSASTSSGGPVSRAVVAASALLEEAAGLMRPADTRPDVGVVAAPAAEADAGPGDESAPEASAEPMAQISAGDLPSALIVPEASAEPIAQVSAGDLPSALIAPEASESSVIVPNVVTEGGSPVGASIDLGATSVHLLVGSVEGHQVVPLLDESEFLGLGDRVSAEGYLGAELRGALIAVLRRYTASARELGARTITIVGTDPMRRAADAPAVVRDAEALLGVPLHVLDHAEEGLLTLIGATGGRPVSGELLLVDIGGGSSEFVSVGLDGRAQAVGLALGATRLTRDLVRSDPPSLAEIEALRREVARIIVQAPEASPAEIVAVGGTASNLLRLLPATAVDRSLTRRRIAVALAMLTVERSGEAAARHLIRPERARILPAGAIIVDAVLERYRADRLRVSEAGIREGTILAAHHGGAAWRDRLTTLALGWAEAPARA